LFFGKLIIVGAVIILVSSVAPFFVLNCVCFLNAPVVCSYYTLLLWLRLVAVVVVVVVVFALRLLSLPCPKRHCHRRHLHHHCHCMCGGQEGFCRLGFLHSIHA
jgi:hypothetical protein